MARLSLDRFWRRRAEPAGAPRQRLRLAPAPGALRRERRALLREREARIRDLGGLILEMFRRNRFRAELVEEQCTELVALEERLEEIDSLLAAAFAARRPGSAPKCECGAPIVWGSHFCANCGRPVGARPVVACGTCGAPLPAEASYCGNCGGPVEEIAESEAAEPEQPPEDTDAGAPPDEQAAEAEAEPVAAESGPAGPDPWER